MTLRGGEDRAAEQAVLHRVANRARNAWLRERIAALTDNELWNIGRTFYGRHAARDLRAALLEALTEEAE